ncbi:MULTISPECIES: hypothetical protein [Desulfovibrio]|uniref:hypothetical protein n=1 Tax=Desulfovibrio TaxID=872 RepID=UPI0026EB07B3|nr:MULTISPECIES: hypothetical protein [Desulfovibrio]MCI7617576.1 hypothetical protein [Desulfovibrio piger]MDY4808171.1 hypothetical protein [Desulfovibrio sp.]
MLKSMLFGGPSGSGSWVVTLATNLNSIYYSSKTNGIALASDGTVYLTGSTPLTTGGQIGAVLAKYSPSGDILWQKIVEINNQLIFGRPISASNDGSIYTCFWFRPNNTSSFEMAKFDSSGGQVWNKVVSTSSPSADCKSIHIAKDGSVYACGSLGISSSYTYAFVVKFSASGGLLWQKKLGIEKKYTSSEYIFVSQDGSVFIFTTAPNAVAKYDSSGNLQWQKGISKGTSIYAGGVSAGDDGSAYAVFTCPGDKYALFVAKFNASGTVQWEKRIYGSIDIYGTGVSVGHDGSLYVCGRVHDSAQGKDSVLLAKYDSSGNLHWQKVFSGGALDYVYSVDVDPDGSVYFGGYTNSTGESCSFLAKMTEDDLSRNDAISFGPFSLSTSTYNAENASITVSAGELISDDSSAGLLSRSYTISDGSFSSTLYKG